MIDDKQSTDKVNAELSDAFSGIPELDYNDLDKHRITVPVVTPENAILSDPTNNSLVLESIPTQVPTHAPIGHDTATTTYEEEAAEALLALGKLPDVNLDNDDLRDDNVNLMPIGGTNTTVDVNPVPIKLGANDVEQVIVNLPVESHIKPVTPVPSTNSGDQSGEIKTKTADSLDNNP